MENPYTLKKLQKAVPPQIEKSAGGIFFPILQKDMVRYRRERHSENTDAEKEYDRTKTEPGTKRADDPKKHPDHGGHYGRCDDCMSGVIVARFTEGYVYGILSAMAAVVLVNYVFTYPYFELNFSITGYPLTFVVMLATAVMVSALTTQIKWQEQIRLEVEKEKTRANLLRAVSHDIRTPLTSIQASASGILDNYDALGRQEKVELLEGIRDESRWLIRMVENLLSITRINGDRAQLQTTWEVVEEVVGGAVGKFQKQFAQIEVETSMPEEVVMAPMDGILVEQVLVNLMENSAIHGKTTTKIRISIQKLPERVLFCVEDNGKGIDPAILPIIFEGQLPTGDHAASDGKRSMGIGLSVCMSIIQAHQGDMKAENMAAHRGARIQFWLPCQEENWMEEA